MHTTIIKLFSLWFSDICIHPVIIIVFTYSKTLEKWSQNLNCQRYFRCDILGSEKLVGKL